MTAAVWTLAGTTAALAVIAGACLWDYERALKRIVALEDEMRLARKSVNAISRKLRDLADETGPIRMDRPTPAQLLAPTRPDLTRQRPQPTPRQQQPVHTGATAAGGRHRPTKKKAS